MTEIQIEGGKYTICHENGVNLHVLRHGQPWLSKGEVVGSKWILGVCEEIEKLRAPIDMVLFCPNCGEQHIDEPTVLAKVFQCHHSDPMTCSCDNRRWTNPAHRSHLCHGCKHVWRPADVATNGVLRLKTRGKKDSSGMFGAATARPVPPTWITEIQSERARQDAKWGGPAHDDEHGVDAWCTLLRWRVDKAQNATRKAVRSRWVQIAALAVAAIESLDRKAAK